MADVRGIHGSYRHMFNNGLHRLGLSKVTYQMNGSGGGEGREPPGLNLAR